LKISLNSFWSSIMKKVRDSKARPLPTVLSAFTAAASAASRLYQKACRFSGRRYPTDKVYTANIQVKCTTDSAIGVADNGELEVTTTKLVHIVDPFFVRHKSTLPEARVGGR
jgi:hypothetical protein